MQEGFFGWFFFLHFYQKPKVSGYGGQLDLTIDVLLPSGVT